MTGLTARLAAELANARVSPLKYAVRKDPVTRSGTVTTEMPKTILQLNSLPFKIDINDYRNAFSAANPTGDYKAAFRIRTLADPVPELTSVYISSPISTEGIWDNIINAASADSKFLYTLNLIAKAQRKFQNFRVSGMGGAPDDWYPVAASPSNWPELVENESNLIELSIDFSEAISENDEFLVLNKQDKILRWCLNPGNHNEEKIELSSNSKIDKIKVRVLYVDFIRPWFDFELFNQSNWGITGIRTGYYSNGRLNDNKGVFPLIATGMLIGSNISVRGNFSETDKAILKGTVTNKSILDLGPFQINNDAAPMSLNETSGGSLEIQSNIRQIIGFISNLIPVCPCISP